MGDEHKTDATEAKTAQPFSADAAEADEARATDGGKARPDAGDDPKEVAASGKVTQRQE